MKRLTDRDFKYVPASKTDIAATFRRIRREQSAKAAESPRTVLPIRKQGAEVTDLEMTRLCAQAMEMDYTVTAKHVMFRRIGSMETYSAYYWPLNDDKQAMALMKKVPVQADIVGPDSRWQAYAWSREKKQRMWSEKYDDLNRAIVEAVSKMQAAK